MTHDVEQWLKENGGPTTERPRKAEVVHLGDQTYRVFRTGVPGEFRCEDTGTYWFRDPNGTLKPRKCDEHGCQAMARHRKGGELWCDEHVEAY